MDIEIIGSVSGQCHYSAEQITAVLKHRITELHYGTQFMGRPGTQLYSGDTDIVKLRSELKLNKQRIREWAVHTLALEQKLAVHHPEKSWFIVELVTGEYTAGNICPRLMPLHTLYATADTCSPQQKQTHLQYIYYDYFRVASEYNKRLDEGLSNFGLDSNNKIYYLDDDIYSWDNFLTFSHVLGVLVRNNQWIDEAFGAVLGDSLHELVNVFFQDIETCALIAGKLRDIFMPDNTRKQVFDNIIARFQNDRVVSKKKHISHRYWAILADVHANLPALEVVLDFLQHENISHGLLLGDVVGYGPYPAACIERLRNSSFEVLKGNHDNAAVTGDIRRGMSSTASWCIEWTIPQLTDTHRQWLEALPLELSGITEGGQHWLAMHGSPIDPQYFYGYVYEMTYEDNLNALEQRKIDFCFHGHTHVQGIYARKKGVSDSFYKEKQQSLLNYRHSLICPGSIGQPRDGNVSAQFAVLDQQDQVITFYNLPYELNTIIDEMKLHAFPESLITRLTKGY